MLLVLLSVSNNDLAVGREYFLNVRDRAMVMLVGESGCSHVVVLLSLVHLKNVV